MASLKEVKTRINSVKSTRKITSAMKMVASAKLHKAQGAIENMLPYQKKLNKILTNFLSADLPIESLQLNHQEDVLDILKTGVIDDNVIKAIEETAAMVAKQYL